MDDTEKHGPLTKSEYRYIRRISVASRLNRAFSRCPAWLRSTLVTLGLLVWGMVPSNRLPTDKRR
jgi:hypothetical protein